MQLLEIKRYTCNTRKTYKHCLEKFFSTIDKPLNEVTQKEVLRILVLSSNLKQNYIDLYTGGEGMNLLKLHKFTPI